jgi:hypothetical protein
MWRPGGTAGTTLGQGIAGMLKKRANEAMLRTKSHHQRGVHRIPWLRALLAAQSTKS